MYLIHPLFNSCYQVQFLKDLIYRFREKFKSVDFGPENDLFTAFWEKRELLQKRATSHFNVYGNSTL